MIWTSRSLIFTVFGRILLIFLQILLFLPEMMDIMLFLLHFSIWTIIDLYKIRRIHNHPPDDDSEKLTRGSLGSLEGPFWDLFYTFFTLFYTFYFYFLFLFYYFIYFIFILFLFPCVCHWYMEYLFSFLFFFFSFSFSFSFSFYFFLFHLLTTETS